MLIFVSCSIIIIQGLAENQALLKIKMTIARMVIFAMLYQGF
nr:MAG TPA: hypothetical protein [Caudoviricetes sp.]